MGSGTGGAVTGGSGGRVGGSGGAVAGGSGGRVAGSGGRVGGSGGGTPNPDPSCSTTNASSGAACTRDCDVPCGFNQLGGKHCTCEAGIYSQCPCSPPPGWAGAPTAGPCSAVGGDGTSASLTGLPCASQWQECIGSELPNGTTYRGCVCLPSLTAGAGLAWACGSTNKWFNPGSTGGGSGGASGGGTEPSCVWPSAAGTQALGGTTMEVSGALDGGMVRYTGLGEGTVEDLPPLFRLANGATLSNVIVGAPGGDGIHCTGSCTLQNVWWEDVGEDAATLLGSSSSQVMTIVGGGARLAEDKVFQHNGPGTMVIRNFCAQDFGKLYRSCGNCLTQHQRNVLVENVSVTPSLATSALVGVNSNYGDVATLRGVFIRGRSITICQRYTGNATGLEPTLVGSGPDGTTCVYNATSDIIYR
jgi:hypothetical protein